MSAEYDRYWSNYPRSGGPVNWHGPHHGDPDPEFQALCGSAERRGLHVFLGASNRVFGPKAAEFRLLDMVSVGTLDGRVVVRKGIRAEESVASFARRAALALGSA